MAYEKQTWDTTSFVNPTRMNHIENGIEGVQSACRTEALARMSPNSGETIVSLLGRFRTEYWNDWDTNTKRFGRFKIKIDGTTDIIFTCQRWNSNSANQWISINPSGTNIRIIMLSFGSSIVVRKYTIASSGLTITDISDNAAESELIYFGEDYS